VVAKILKDLLKSSEVNVTGFCNQKGSFSYLLQGMFILGMVAFFRFISSARCHASAWDMNAITRNGLKTPRKGIIN